MGREERGAYTSLSLQKTIKSADVLYVMERE